MKSGANIRYDFYPTTFVESRYEHSDIPKTYEGVFERFEAIQEEFPYINSNAEIVNFVFGNDLINIHAIHCVLLSLKNTLQHVDNALESVKEEDSKHNRRTILMMSFKLAAFFDFTYSAMVCDQDGIFWKAGADEDLCKMFEHYTYEEPVDLDTHFEEINTRLEQFDYMVAVASKGLSSGSLVKQIFNGVRFALKFKNDKERTSRQANFFMNVFKEKTLFRMLKVSELDIVKAQAK